METLPVALPVPVASLPLALQNKMPVAVTLAVAEVVRDALPEPDHIDDPEIA